MAQLDLEKATDYLNALKPFARPKSVPRTPPLPRRAARVRWSWVMQEMELRAEFLKVAHLIIQWREVDGRPTLHSSTPHVSLRTQPSFAPLTPQSPCTGAMALFVTCCASNASTACAASFSQSRFAGPIGAKHSQYHICIHPFPRTPSPDRDTRHFKHEWRCEGNSRPAPSVSVRRRRREHHYSNHRAHGNLHSYLQSLPQDWILGHRH